MANGSRRVPRARGPVESGLNADKHSQTDARTGDSNPEPPAHEKAEVEGCRVDQHPFSNLLLAPYVDATQPSAEPRSGAISGADGLRAIRNRGRFGGSGRRPRGRSQAPRAVPAGMKSLDPSLATRQGLFPQCEQGRRGFRFGPKGLKSVVLANSGLVRAPIPEPDGLRLRDVRLGRVPLPRRQSAPIHPGRWRADPRR